jgi:hypothetical protein
MLVVEKDKNCVRSARMIVFMGKKAANSERGDDSR